MSLLDAAAHKSKREVLELIAAKHPQPAVASSLSRLVDSRSMAEAAEPPSTVTEEPTHTDPLTLVDVAREELARSELEKVSVRRQRRHGARNARSWNSITSCHMRKGGKTTVDNIELRCRAHNAYEMMVSARPAADAAGSGDADASAEKRSEDGRPPRKVPPKPG